VEGVIDFLRPDSVETVEVTREDVEFVLPKQLRGDSTERRTQIRGGAA
jgi:hypothetical protein